MSEEALALKRQQMEDYFLLHPDKIDIYVLSGKKGSAVLPLVPGLFDSPIKGEDARQMGAVEFHKRTPSLSIYTGNSSRFTSGTTWVRIGTDTKEYKVREKSPDKTPGSYQTILWLV